MRIKKNPSEKYWARRAAERMVDYQADAERAANDIGKAYATANSSMQADMHKIFSTFERSFKVSENQAKQIFAAVGNDSAMKELKKAAMKLSDPEQRQLALDALTSAPAYSWRIARLDNMLDSVAKNCNQIYKTDLSKTTDFLGKITKKAYNRTTYDLQVGTGTLGAAFDEFSDSRVKQILKTNWSGIQYSKRIYANVEDMQTKLKQTLLEGVFTGESEHTLAAKVAERWQIGFNDARRLIRTETTYVANQAELESYQNAGITEYKYVAVLDSVTSEVCHDLNGKKFPVSEAVPGENYPPMHPWCRSTTVAVIPDDWGEEAEPDEIFDEWLDADTELSYKEWVEQLQTGEDGKVRYVPPKTETSAPAVKPSPKSAPEAAIPQPTAAPEIEVPEKIVPTTPKSVPAKTVKPPEAKAVEITFEEPTIAAVDTPTVKTTEKIYTAETAKRVDISGGSGIIKERTRKATKQRLGLRFINDETFNNLTIEARKKGANILRGTAEVEKHLDDVGASASNIGDTLLFRKDVCISDVLEETYHYMQNLNNLNSDKPEPLRTILNEIDAKKYLLDNSKKYKIPRNETETTEKQLSSYEEELEKYMKENSSHD